MMGGVLLLLSGASGAGKTTVRDTIAAPLAPRVDAVELGHLGAIPPIPDLAWRQRMVELAVLRARALAGEGRHLLLAGDPVAPGGVLAEPSAPQVDIAICLLDVNEAEQRRRLRARGEPAELLGHHVAFTGWLRRHARDPDHLPQFITTGGWDAMQWSRWTDRPRDGWQMPIIGGSGLDPTEAGRRVAAWVSDAIAGRPRVFRRGVG
jgi:hypothetical protein